MNRRRFIKCISSFLVSVLFLPQEMERQKGGIIKNPDIIIGGDRAKGMDQSVRIIRGGEIILPSTEFTKSINPIFYHYNCKCVLVKQ
jgi:hypothetical protein